MNKLALLIILVLIVIMSAGAFVRSFNILPQTNVYYPNPDLDFWPFRSVDTMKYSRDLGREKLEDPGFDAVIDEQVKKISGIGATHVAIATPYDTEFIPMLKRWVNAARKYKLNVWFRGNFSGWEEWFDYPRITTEDHTKKTKEFIYSNYDLFEDGDIFSSCPECENGGPGDPRRTGDVEEFRRFIAGEYREARSAFKAIGKKVQSNYFSMNADVARLVMDRETTEALDGIVAIDHYVSAPEQLARDIEDIADKSGGKVVLGEFGAPIPDIHGELTDAEQADWLNRALWILKDIETLKGINYWSAVGGSTAIWDEDGREKEAAGVLNKYYASKNFYGVVHDELDGVIPNAKISYSGRELLSDDRGYFEFPYIDGTNAVAKFSASGYLEKEHAMDPGGRQEKIVLVKKNKGIPFRFAEAIKNILAE